MKPKLNGIEGDNGSPIGVDWRHHGPSDWLLHPQWSRDYLLPFQVSLVYLGQVFIIQVLPVPQVSQS